MSGSQLRQNQLCPAECSRGEWRVVRGAYYYYHVTRCQAPQSNQCPSLSLNPGDSRRVLAWMHSCHVWIVAPAGERLEVVRWGHGGHSGTRTLTRPVSQPVSRLRAVIITIFKTKITNQPTRWWQWPDTQTSAFLVPCFQINTVMYIWKFHNMRTFIDSMQNPAIERYITSNSFNIYTIYDYINPDRLSWALIVKLRSLTHCALTRDLSRFWT